jgi:hypothetical protein
MASIRIPGTWLTKLWANVRDGAACPECGRRAREPHDVQHADGCAFKRAIAACYNVEASELPPLPCERR